MSVSGAMYSQNVITESISAKGIDKILIDGNQIFQIYDHSEKRTDIKISSKTDGEYQNGYKIFSELKNGQLYIKLFQTPFFEIPDDKRNAHKVVAATLEVIMPEYLDMTIRSDIGTVWANGLFKYVIVELFQGACIIKGRVDTALIQTFTGDITVETQNASIEAKSNNGLVSVEEYGYQTSHWLLRTIDGNIQVTKPK